MNPASALEAAEISKGHEPELATPVYRKESGLSTEKEFEPLSARRTDSEDSSLTPTEEELHTLHRVSGRIPWQAYTIAFVELCERFSYYGTTVVFVNFIQRPMPEGSNTGAVGRDGVPGALGMGQRASTGLTTFNAFWAYVMPILGAYIADTYLGRFKTIQWAILVALIGHVILIISAIPPVIVHPNNAIAAFAIGLVIMGVGVGMFKSNISPLIAEQYRETKVKITTTKKGERVIMDPAITVSRIYLYFYMMINIGAIAGQVSMVYAERYVGFWLSYLLPTIMFCLCPMVMFACRKKYNTTKPAGSVLGKSFKLWKLAMKGHWSINPVATVRHAHGDPDFWNRVKPSRMGSDAPGWMTFDDVWVDEVARGLKACTVFLWMPIYWLSYNQMNNNLTSQAATMRLNGTPNDILNNLNPLSLIIFIPLVDHLLYPSLRRAGIRFTPIKRIFTGFMLGALAMMTATIIQHYIYETNPCGKQANYCLNELEEHSPINVWAQTPAYVLIGLSEIFANITSLEYAFTKAPKNMRSLVMSINLFMSAIGSAINQGMVALSADPLLVWNYGVVAVICFVTGFIFFFVHKDLDRREDQMNNLPPSDLPWKGRKESKTQEA